MKKYLQKTIGNHTETVAEFDYSREGEKKKARNELVDQELKNPRYKFSWSDKPCLAWSKLQVHREMLNSCSR